MLAVHRSSKALNKTAIPQTDSIYIEELPSRVRTFLIVVFAGDIAPDIVLLSKSNGNSMYDDPMEYQRTKRSYIHEDDNEDDDNDDDIGDEGFDEDEDEDDRSDSLTKNLNYPDSSVLHKKDEIHQMHVKAARQQQPLKTEDGESTDDSGSSDDDEGSSSGSGSGEIREEGAHAR